VDPCLHGMARPHVADGGTACRYGGLSSSFADCLYILGASTFWIPKSDQACNGIALPILLYLLHVVNVHLP
jgi:hypothetical protein